MPIAHLHKVDSHCDLNCKLAHPLRVIMAVHTTSLLGLLAAITLLVAPASVFAVQGEATYYGPPFVPSKCYGYDTGPFGPEPYMIAAASPDLYNNGAACGVSYQVTCLGATSGAAGGCSSTPTVTVKVVDLCPGCFQPGLDLSPDAFNVISNTAVGRINVDIQQV